MKTAETQRLIVLSRVLGFPTLEAFAAALGINPSYLSQVGRAGLNQRFISRILKKFPRVNPDYLTEGVGDPLFSVDVDPAEAQRAGQIRLIVSILNQLDGPTLSILLEAIDQFKASPHYSAPDDSAEKDKKN